MMGLGYDIPVVALRSCANATPQAFSPLSTSPAIFLDPSEMGTLFQDHSGTTPVTADNQPIGLCLDQSANQNDLTQSVSAARPTFRSDGNQYWIETDGVDDSLVSASVFQVGNPLTMVFGYQMLSAAGTSRVNLAEISRTSTNGMSVGVRPNIDRLQYYSRLSDQGVTTSNVAASVWGGHAKHVVTLQASSGNVKVRMDGQVVLDEAQNLATQSVQPHPLRVGLGVVTGSIPGAFRLFGLQVWTAGDAQPTSAQLVDLEQWMAAKTGISI